MQKYRSALLVSQILVLLKYICIELSVGSITKSVLVFGIFLKSLTEHIFIIKVLLLVFVEIYN